MRFFTCGTSHLDVDPAKFGRCTFAELAGLARNPTDRTNDQLGEDGSTRPLKEKTFWFMPSDCPTKRKSDVIAHGNYCLLVADIDEGNHDPEDVANTLLDLGVESFIIYDTLSSTQESRRHRVVIELASTVGWIKWKILQRALMVLLNADPCALNPNQISYMPTMSSCNKDCYRVTVSDGLSLDPERSQFAMEADELEALQPDEAAIRQEKQAYTLPPTYDLGTEEYRNPIDLFNQVTSWDTLLGYCGFKRIGTRWLPPTSQSGVPGAIVSRDIRPQGAYFSKHTSDPLADGLPHDKFDVWMVHGLGLNHHCSADVAKASTEFARNYTLPDGYTLEAKNRYLYATQQKYY